MNPLQQLEAFGQSPWLDFIQRSFTAEGKLGAMIGHDGLKGVTSNPAIFQKAMGEGTDYDVGFKALADAGDHDALDIYEALAIQDIQAACDVMRPVFDATGRVDGYVSLEVSPYLALYTDETVAEARRLWQAVGRENLMVKVPGTDKGAAAIRTLISEGLNINVTLLFSQKAYEAVAEAFIAGLEDRAGRGESVVGISSVASFFVSRIDAVMDKKIDASDDPDVKALRGKIAIANAKLAYQSYLAMTAGPRWQILAQQGALPQRLLWASTGVKDKAYSDVLYVEELIGRDTVNTIPPATMDAFRDHGTPRESLTEDLDGAVHILAEAERLGLDLEGVTLKLVEDGVQLFATAADTLLSSVAAKRTAMVGGALLSMDPALPDDLQKSVQDTLEDWRAQGKLRDLWSGKSKLWTGGDEDRWLGWLHAPDAGLAALPQLQAFADMVKADGYQNVLLLGMGGSSLGPEVLGAVFPDNPGFPTLVVLDSTDPAQVAHTVASVDLTRTLVIVSSKSGGTLEPNIFKAYVWDRMRAALGPDRAAKQFAAVTDPGSKMQAIAEQDGFANVFMGDPSIGGRYSVLSNFGLVPGAAIGLDLRGFLQSALMMAHSCAAGTPPKENPGVLLGAILGQAAIAGRDKVTVVASPGIKAVGAWLEQLLAESTGKQGNGIVPVDDEPLGAPEVYGADRVFAYLRLAQAADPAQDAAMDALSAAGHPVVRCTLHDPMQVAQLFYLWEFATAVAGAVIGIHPFDQPDVEASKVETKKLTDEVAKSGHLPPETPFLEADGIKLFTDPANHEELEDDTLDGVIRTHLRRAEAGDYVALLAYIEHAPNIEALRTMRTAIRDRLHVATCVGFGPRFLHSTGQAYKGGPNSGVFLQITCDDAEDLAVPGAEYTFGTVKAAQARGDFAVLAERQRRALRVHLGPDVSAGLDRLAQAIQSALT